MLALASFVCGLIFGFGLLISGMTQPSKVLGFLDIFGRWDPTLAFVMAAALGATGIGFSLVRQRTQPVLATQHLWPTRTDLDRPLIVGSVLFGIGWGLVGLCPGPALVDLAGMMLSVMVFVLAMAAGMIINDLCERHMPPRRNKNGRFRSNSRHWSARTSEMSAAIDPSTTSPTDYLWPERVGRKQCSCPRSLVGLNASATCHPRPQARPYVA
jgi:hypothetical protein